MKEQREAIAAMQANLAAKGKPIIAESHAIDAQRTQINRRDTKAVAAFNARLARNIAAMNAYSAALAPQQRAVAGLNSQADQFNIDCASRPYDRADLAQLPVAQRLAMESGTHDIEIPLLPPPPARDVAGAPAAVAGKFVVLVPSADAARTSASAGGITGTGLTLAKLKGAAESGNADAQFELAERLNDGIGVPRDPAAALEWLLKAAAQHHAVAAFNASNLLNDGVNVPADKPKALVLLRQAADAGQPAAEHNLALWYARDAKEPDHLLHAVEWMSRAADHGDPESQYVLAGFYRGTGGFPRDLTAATTRLHQSAEQGFRPAQLDLGRAYAKGDGVPRDPVEALKWYRLAAGMTKLDASQGCTRRMLQDNETRTRATEAANALAAKLPPYEADKAAANAEEWVGAVRARQVSGCGRPIR